MRIDRIKTLSAISLIIMLLSLCFVGLGAYYFHSYPETYSIIVQKESSVRFRFENVKVPGEDGTQYFDSNDNPMLLANILPLGTTFDLRMRAMLFPGAKIEAVIVRSVLLEPTEYKFMNLNMPTKLDIDSALIIPNPNQATQTGKTGMPEPVYAEVQFKDFKVVRENPFDELKNKNIDRSELVIEIQGYPAPEKSDGNAKATGMPTAPRLKSELIRFPFGTDSLDRLRKYPARRRMANTFVYGGLAGLAAGILIGYFVRNYTAAV